MKKLSCFQAYDIRGKIGININEPICYRIGRAVAQHFKAKTVVIGFDARKTSPQFAKAAIEGIKDAGSDAIDIGMAGTEEMYWSVTEFGSDAGIIITASHNPINYNGMKIVKANSCPLDEKKDFEVIKTLAETEAWVGVNKKGRLLDRASIARNLYVRKVLSFIEINLQKPMKIVVNSGNGAAGPTFEAIASKLKERRIPVQFIHVHSTPDHNFPNGIPNPLIPSNRIETAKIVRNECADFGIAFDGDFDRCFFFDENGRFIPGEYVVGLLASIFLERERGATIVHDPRVVWNVENIVQKKGGSSIQSKTGHAYIKQTMRQKKAIYGGEMSAHHYFRDFAFCDSGMIPWILVAEWLSYSQSSFGEWLNEQLHNFPSSGEINFVVEDVELSLSKVLKNYQSNSLSTDKLDGISIVFKTWRFNLRRSNTESLIRLNVESKNDPKELEYRIEEISKIIGGTRL